MKNKADRMNHIIEILKSKNGSTTKDLASQFQVSEMTIRRDVKILAEKGIVSNLYGAVVINPINPVTDSGSGFAAAIADYQLDCAVISHQPEKDRIGAFAASLLTAGDTLIIDTGSTTEAIARHIPANLPLTVLCYNHNILSHLLGRENIKLSFSGGIYHPNTQMFESKEGCALIRNMRATKVFVSAAGVHESMGVTCIENYEVDTKQAIMASGFERILVADSSKFSVIQPAYFAGLNEFHTIITDNGLSDEWKEIIKEMGITLHTV